MVVVYARSAVRRRLLIPKRPPAEEDDQDEEVERARCLLSSMLRSPCPLSFGRYSMTPVYPGHRQIEVHGVGHGRRPLQGS